MELDSSKLRSLPREVREYLEEMADRVNKTADTLFSPGASTGQDFPGGFVNNPDTTDLVYINVRLTSFGNNEDSVQVAYAWVEQSPISGGGWQDKVDGLTGTATTNPAYERNGRSVGHLPWYVKIERGFLNDGTDPQDSDLEWVFDYNGC